MATLSSKSVMKPEKYLLLLSHGNSMPFLAGSGVRSSHSHNAHSSQWKHSCWRNISTKLGNFLAEFCSTKLYTPSQNPREVALQSNLREEYTTDVGLVDPHVNCFLAMS